ncbi:hypothetical protein D3C86_2176430 [compost metagenome]
MFVSRAYELTFRKFFERFDRRLYKTVICDLGLRVAWLRVSPRDRRFVRDLAVTPASRRVAYHGVKR